MKNSRLIRTKTLLALSFVSGAVYGAPPGLCADANVAKYSIIERTAARTDLAPDDRAYMLLKIADAYLENANEAAVERLWSDGVNHSSDYNFHKEKFLEEQFRMMALKKSVETKSARSKKLAGDAVLAAISQLKQAKDKAMQAKFAYAGAKILKRAGLDKESNDCLALVTQFLQSTAMNKKASASDIKVAADIYECMAFDFVPVTNIIDYSYWDKQPAFGHFTERAFLQAEKLRLRGVAIADRLSATDHVRRKAHRDLVLWYAGLGKTLKEEKEKQILFDLVGVRDDSILQPRNGGCGREVWWTAPDQKIAGHMCGMG